MARSFEASFLNDFQLFLAQIQGPSHFKGQDLALIAKPHENMVDARWIFDKVWSKPYRQRQVVEGVVHALKNICGMVGSTVRSADCARCRVLSALALYCMPNWES